MSRSSRLLLVLLLVMVPLPGVAAAPEPILVFDFELIDTSLEGELKGERLDQAERLVLISRDLRRRLAESGRYRVTGPDAAAERIAGFGALNGCPGCAAQIARELGIPLALSGTVQKVSNLILNLNLYLHDAAGGRVLRAMSVDIRGNTDESWLHGLSYIVRNRFLKDPK